MKSFKVGKKTIGDGYPTYIVGEMAWSHDGSIDKAKVIIEACKNAGCDAINFHITCLEDYMVPHYQVDEKSSSAFEKLEELALPFDAWPELFNYAKKIGIQISALCNDLKSVELVKKLDPDVCMFHASCITEGKLVRNIARIGKPVFFAMGGSTIEEISQAIKWLVEEGCDKIALLYGIQSYPTELPDNNMNFLVTLKSMFGRPVGFSGHTDAEDPLALVVPLMSIPLGANILEKHVTYDRSKKGTDYFAALNPEEIKIFVDHVRRIETVFGSSKIRPFSEAEKNYRQLVRKRIVAIKDLKKGHILSDEDVHAMRATKGISPDQIKIYLGKELKKDIKKYESITEDLF